MAFSEEDRTKGRERKGKWAIYTGGEYSRRERERERISILDMTCQPDSEISKERGEGLSEGWKGREGGEKKRVGELDKKIE